MASFEGITTQELRDLFQDENIENGNSLDWLKKISLNGLQQKLKTNSKIGIRTIDQVEIDARKQAFGQNSPPEARAKSFWHCVYVSTEDFCIRILSLAAILMFVCGFLAENPTEVFAQAFSVLLAVFAVIFIAGTTDWKKD